MEAYFIIKAILRSKFNINRIAYRDAQAFFSILLDDSNRKTICRLYLNGNKKFIGTLDSDKKETKTEITSLDDIYNFEKQLVNTIENYDKTPA